MKRMLDDVGPLAEGQTVNVHHCKDGHNNDRCYISNVGERTLFYCHHCGNKGSLTNSLAAYKRKTQGAVRYPSLNHNLPADGITEPSEWSVEATVWLNNAGLSYQDAKNRGFCYSPRFNRVCIPINFDGEYIGYTGRLVGGEGPKYLARSKREDRDKLIYINNNITSKEVFIVEDILSSIRINNLNYNSISLLGVNINNTLLNYITKYYNMYYIWLDNDNPTVKMKQIELKNRLSLFGTVKLIKTDNDPKCYSDSELQTIINQYR